jgi:hypothetical protein
MALVIYFILIDVALTMLAYFIGLGVEAMWSSAASLVVFLGLYFSSIWLAWKLAVWLTEPKGVATTDVRLGQARL